MLQQIAHILVAMMVILSTTGMTISKHYCQKQLKGIAILVDAENCHETTQKSCHKSNSEATPKGCCANKTIKELTCSLDTNDAKDNCCHNETNYVKNDEQQLIKSTINLTINPDWSLVAVIYYLSYLVLEPTSNDFNHHTNYTFPSLHRNTRTMMQSFLC